MHESLFFAQENVLCNAQARQCAHFLNDNGDTLVVGIDLSSDFEFVVLKKELSAGNRIDSAQHRTERRLAGTILANQSVNFAFFELKRNIFDGVRNSKVLVDLFRS